MEENKSEVLEAARAAAAAYAPGLSIGWRDEVMNAETLADGARVFNIELYHTDALGDGCQVLPIFNEVYHSGYFTQLLSRVAPFMADGRLELLDSDYGLYVVEFKGGRAKVIH